MIAGFLNGRTFIAAVLAFLGIVLFLTGLPYQLAT